MKLVERVKISCGEGAFGQIRVLNIPVAKYERIDGKLRFSAPHIRREKNSNRCVAYLKYNNQTNYYSPWCLQHWLNIFAELDYDCYIVCDNPNLEKRLLKTLYFPRKNIEFIKSNKHIPKGIMETVCTANWKNAAYAHLTTFYHAKKNGISEFWNIDADDTSFMHNHVAVADVLRTAEEKARANDMDLFSLDMHRTRYYGKHWTFGVTFSRMKKDWKELLFVAKDTTWRTEFSKFHEAGFYNVDSYFTWLKNHKYASIGTFNIDNLYFVHWGGVSIVNFYRAVQVEKDGTLYFPIGLRIFNDNEFSMLPTAQDVVNIEAGVTEAESFKFLQDVVYGFIRMNSVHCKES